MTQRLFAVAYAVLLGSFATLYAVILPAFQVPDETGHYWRAFELANDRCLPPRDFVAPTSYVSEANVFHPWIERDLTLSNGKLAGAELRSIAATQGALQSKVWFHGLDNYSCVLYLPQSIAIRVVSQFGGSLLLSLYAARIVVALTCVCMMVIGFRQMPFGKPLYVVLSALPMSLQQIGSVSADALTIAFAFLGLATILRFAFRQRTTKLSRGQFGCLFVLAIALGCGKLDAIVLVMAFLIPAARFGGSLRKIAVVGSLLIVGLSTNIAFLNANHLSAGTALLDNRHAIDPHRNLRAAIEHPSLMVNEIFVTLGASWATYLRQTVGTFGWLTLYMPRLAVAFAWGAICYLTLHTGVDTRFRSKARLVAVAVGALSIGATFAALYVGETPLVALENHLRGQYVPIEGLQGRYFLTSLLPIALAVSGRGRRALRFDRSFALGVSAILAVVGLVTIVDGYYR